MVGAQTLTPQECRKDPLWAFLKDSNSCPQRHLACHVAFSGGGTELTTPEAGSGWGSRELSVTSQDLSAGAAPGSPADPLAATGMQACGHKARTLELLGLGPTTRLWSRCGGDADSDTCCPFMPPSL